MDGTWIGFDLDGTLCQHGTGTDKIGAPIPGMVELMKAIINQGFEVRIFTARMALPLPIAKAQEKAIQEWCEKHVGYIPEITCVKDFGMIYCFDDRCIQVLTNNGILVTKEGCFTAEDIAHDLPSLLRASRKPTQEDHPSSVSDPKLLEDPDVSIKEKE